MESNLENCEVIAQLRQSTIPQKIIDHKGGKLKPCDHEVVGVMNPEGKSRFLLVCEHASFDIPERYNNLGLLDENRLSHAVWDIGALNVSYFMARQLDAPLVASKVSRLVCDLNRYADDYEAVSPQSELISVPGNVGLDHQARQERLEKIYQPFFEVVNGIIHVSSPETILVTIHSFTPTYFGKKRSVEIGVLHTQDSRLADALLNSYEAEYTVARNEPYDAGHMRFAHTLHVHGNGNNLLNVALEVRNDLIQTAEQQKEIAIFLSQWLRDGIKRLG